MASLGLDPQQMETASAHARIRCAVLDWGVVGDPYLLSRHERESLFFGTCCTLYITISMLPLEDTVLARFFSVFDINYTYFVT